MTIAQILGYPLLPIAALEFFLGLLLLRQNTRKSPVNRATAACAFATAIWSLSTALMYILLSRGRDYHFFVRLNWIGWLTIPTALQSLHFLIDERSRKARIAGWILYPFWTVVLWLSLFTNLVVTDRYVPLPYRNSPGPLDLPLRLIGGLLIFWVYYEIIRVRKRVTGYRRTQLSFYLYGCIVFGTAGAVIGGFLQLFTGRGLEPSLSAYFSLPWVVMIFYAITRYRLFDTRLVVSRTLNILLLSAGISGLQYVLFTALQPATGDIAAIFISIPLIALLFFGTNLSSTVQVWINDLVLGSRYAYQTILRKSAEAMITILQRDELLRFIVDSVRSGLGVGNACLALEENGHAYVMKQFYGAYEARTPNTAVLPGVADLLRRFPAPVLRDELESRPPGSADEIAAWMRAEKIEIILPLSCKGQLLGMLMLGERNNGDPYLPSDLEVLQMLAGHAAVAIENARLFEEAVRMRASLRESENVFKVLADTTAAAIVIHRGGKHLFANAAAARLTGYSIDELLNMEFWSFVHPEHQGLVRTRGEGGMTGAESPNGYEFKVLTKEGEERWAFVTAGLIELDGRPAVIATLVDITALKRSEEERERLSAEKEKMVKDLHDGIGGMSTNINLLAELAQKSGDLTDVRRTLATISALAQENLSEIRGFIQSRDARDLTWQTVAAELRHLGSAIIEPHGIRLAIGTAVGEDSAPPRSAVTMNLFRIYKESLVNVVKHARAASVEVAFTVSGDAIVLDIRDNGIGLDGKRGNGRGLMNMKTRVEELGGKFTLFSGGGTRVLVEIPLIPPLAVA